MKLTEFLEEFLSINKFLQRKTAPFCVIKITLRGPRALIVCWRTQVIEYPASKLI